MDASINYIIVTNSYKRPLELVERSLKASLNQVIKPSRVILIDQNTPPIELSETILNNPLFERQNSLFTSVSAARNSLIIPNETEWIFFCDDDGYPASDYSEKLSDLIKENPDLKIFSGIITRDDNNQPYSLRHKKGGSLKHFLNTKNLMGSNFVVSTRTFNQLERFDDRFGAGAFYGSSEETDFCWKAYFHNVPMEFFKDLVVFHIPPFNETISKGFKKSFYYGVGKGALVSKWLFINKKLTVLLEVFEMLLIPPIQIIRGIITLKPGLITSNIASFAGRLVGTFKFFIFK